VLALVAAALALHVALGFAARHGSVPGDRAAFDVFAGHHPRWAVDATKVLTNLGALYTAAAIGIATALYLAAQGRRRDGIALLGGLLLLALLVTPLKHVWGRPRPEHMLAHARGLSYPSGHAAYATTWVACAYELGGRSLRIAAAAVVLWVLTSRVYLHVHYLSDVVGGVALGVAAFAVVGAIRDNPPTRR
jgi:membrane-associated phospholipid phosphatase